MDVGYKNKKTARQFNDTVLNRIHGLKRATRIRVRLASLKQAENLAVFWPPKSGPERCHELSGERAGQFTVDLDHPYRLIFVPNHDPVPKLPSGGTDWQAITAITILGIEDTHE